MKDQSRRSFIGKASALFGALCLSFISISKAKPQKKMLGTFYHVVYFWLKEPDNQSVRKQFLSNLNGFLDQVDEIQTRHVGSPSSTDRSVIDTSYTFSLILSFKNKKEQDVYQDHAAHKKFIADSEAMWEKVQVYDSELL